MRSMVVDPGTVHRSTDDAYVQGNIALLSPRIGAALSRPGD